MVKETKRDKKRQKNVLYQIDKEAEFPIWKIFHKNK